MEFADRMGIARFCLFKGARSDRDMSPEDLREQNEELLRAVRRYSHRRQGNRRRYRRGQDGLSVSAARLLRNTPL